MGNAGRRLAVAATTAAALAVPLTGGGSAALGVPLRYVKMTENSSSTVAARATVFLPPDARYCHAFVRSYLVAATPSDWKVIARYGKFTVRFSPCRAGRWDSEGVGVRFRDTGGGTRKICFEAWTPLRNGTISRHYACTGSFTRR